MASAGGTEHQHVVLVVEDSDVTRESLGLLFHMEGYRVATAPTGRVALQLMVTMRFRPCVVVADLMMPEMDGFDFLEELRGDEAGRHVPVVVITARDLTAEDHRRLNGSVERILQKGAYGREELLAEVRRLVRASIDKRRAAP